MEWDGTGWGSMSSDSSEETQPFEDAAADGQRISDDDCDEATALQRIARLQNAVADLRRSLGQRERALQPYHEQVLAYEELLGISSAKAAAQYGLAMALRKLRALQLELSQSEAAAESYRRAVDLLVEALQGVSPEREPWTLFQDGLAGFSYDPKTDYVGWEAVFHDLEHAAAACTEALQCLPNDETILRCRIDFLVRLAELQRAWGADDAAVGAYQQADSAYDQLLSTVSDEGTVAQRVGLLRRFGEFFCLLDREVEAEECFRKAIGVAGDLSSEQSQRVAIYEAAGAAYLALGRLKLECCDHELALQAFGWAHDLFARASRLVHGGLYATHHQGLALRETGKVQAAAGDYEDALFYSRKAVETFDVALDLDPGNEYVLEDKASTCWSMAVLFDLHGEKDAALTSCRDVVAASDEILRMEPRNPTALCLKLRSFIAMGQLQRHDEYSYPAYKSYSQAISLSDAAVRSELEAYPFVYRSRGDAYQGLAEIHMARHKVDDAASAYNWAVSSYEKATDQCRFDAESSLAQGRAQRNLADIETKWFAATSRVRHSESEAWDETIAAGDEVDYLSMLDQTRAYVSTISHLSVRAAASFNQTLDIIPGGLGALLGRAFSLIDGHVTYDELLNIQTADPITKAEYIAQAYGEAVHFNPEDVELILAKARALTDLGRAYSDSEDVDDSEENGPNQAAAYSVAVESYRSALELVGDDIDDRKVRASILAAICEITKGSVHEAALRELIVTVRGIVGYYDAVPDPDSNDVELLLLKAEAVHRLAALEGSQRAADFADIAHHSSHVSSYAIFRRAIAVCERIVTLDPDNCEAWMRLIAVLSDLGHAEIYTRHYAAAIDACREGLQVCQEAVKRCPSSAHVFPEATARLWDSIGEAQSRLSSWEDASLSFWRSMAATNREIAQAFRAFLFRKYGPNHAPGTLREEYDLAALDAFTQDNSPVRGSKRSEEEVAVWERQGKELEQSAEKFLGMNQRDIAAEFYRLSLRVYKKASCSGEWQENRDRGRAIRDLAYAQLRISEDEDARASFALAAKQFRRALDFEPSDTESQHILDDIVHNY